MSILSGHTRYAHISRLKCDTVNPPLLGMEKIVSEDAVRRALLKLDETDSISWLQSHLNNCYQPLLIEPWILDVDTTIKLLYGRQEGAVVGYNPHKPGRPSHTYHSYMIANLRIILGIEVQAGNESSSKHTAPGLWQFLKNLAKTYWPRLIRGDCNFGNEGIIQSCEQNSLPYLFKLKASKKVKLMIAYKMTQDDWVNAGQGYEGSGSTLQLMGWTKPRRVIILRRKLPQEVAITRKNKRSGQLEFDFANVSKDINAYEYSVLVTSLADEILTVAQLYRDRADSENAFDELKNQWGWCGFTTKDIKRCRLMANMIALIYNWWSLFTRLADPSKHTEAITSRPLMLTGIGRQTNHARQTRITISNPHAQAPRVQKILTGIITFFKTLKSNAEQFTPEQRWYLILSRAFVKYLKGRILKPPNSLLPAH